MGWHGETKITAELIGKVTSLEALFSGGERDARNVLLQQEARIKVIFLCRGTSVGHEHA